MLRRRLVLLTASLSNLTGATGRKLGSSVPCMRQWATLQPQGYQCRPTWEDQNEHKGPLTASPSYLNHKAMSLFIVVYNGRIFSNFKQDEIKGRGDKGGDNRGTKQDHRL